MVSKENIRVSMYTLSRGEDTHLRPSFPERANANGSIWIASDVLDFQKLVLAPKGQEMREEGVEVRFRA